MFVGEGISLSLCTKSLTKRFKLDSEFDILLANISIISVYKEDDEYKNKSTDLSQCTIVLAIEWCVQIDPRRCRVG